MTRELYTKAGGKYVPQAHGSTGDHFVVQDNGFYVAEGWHTHRSYHWWDWIFWYEGTPLNVATQAGYCGA